MTRILGTVTIGQSPRVDLIPEVEQILWAGRGPLGAERPGVEPGLAATPAMTAGAAPPEIIEAGALDGLTLAEVERLAPHPGDYVLVTRMADGTPVKIAEKHILPLMQDRIDALVKRGADVVALVCTGEFPPFKCDRLLVIPQTVLFNVVAAVASGLRLGVFLPDSDQVDDGMRRWAGVSTTLRIEAASPYGRPEAIDEAAARLRDWGAQTVVMDCIGYTLGMKDRVKHIAGVPVILARSILARVLSELI